MSFWSKRRLLVPAEGGQGKGSHRRYTFPQVNIASIYAVFRDHFGANISTLTSLADLFQGAVETFENSPLIASEWAAAASLAQALHDFRTGTPVMVSAHDYDEPGYGDLDIDESMRKRPALSESEVIAAKLSMSDGTPVAQMLRYAESLGPGHYEEARIAQVIVGSVLTPAHLGDICWLMRQTPSGWQVREGSDEYNFNGVHDTKDFGPALFIPVGSMIRQIWGIPHFRMVRRITEGKELAARLANFGIVATLTPIATEEEGFDIMIASGSRKRAEEILSRHGYTMPPPTDAKS